MLDAFWRDVVSRSPNTPAVHLAGSGESWTFAQLADAADASSATSPISFPSGHGIAFLLEILRAWKACIPVCPLEPGQSPPAFPAPPPDIAHLKLTSGTTGSPRLIAFTAAQLAADARHIVDTMKLHPEQPNLGVISLAHSYGFSNLVTPLLLHGIPLVLAPSALPASILAAARSLPGFTLPAVPALWRTWTDANAIPGNLRLAISAGAPLPLPLEQLAFDQHHLKIHNFLGASECGGIAFDSSTTPRTDPACVGSALHGVSVATGPDACLVVTSAAVASGYWPDPDPRLAQGSYASADLARILPDGSLHITGRASDIINVAGRKIAPEPIEAALATHPAVRDCLALAIVEPGGRGEAVGMIYALKEPVPESELRAHLIRQLPAWQIPRHWWLRNDLRADDRGKRSRTAWRNLLSGKK
jgi:acyl-coenzyme A synthetase/AMP-(fatty) acid ligase